MSRVIEWLKDAILAVLLCFSLDPDMKSDGEE
jgi:hypothetical protein